MPWTHAQLNAAVEALTGEDCPNPLTVAMKIAKAIDKAADQPEQEETDDAGHQR